MTINQKSKEEVLSQNLLVLFLSEVEIDQKMELEFKQYTLGAAMWSIVKMFEFNNQDQ